MNQICKVCDEPAAGFHFGAFTCEGCKSFFGRSYNNLSSISECKNNSQCVINKKNRTACKACRLRKCLRVGMSKSGSRYGRRSNWFKIHCLLQEQQQQQQQQNQQSNSQQQQQAHNVPPLPPILRPPTSDSTSPHRHQIDLRLLEQTISNINNPLMHLPRTQEELLLFGLDEYNKNSASPSVSSPESHNSDSSVEISDARRLPIFPGLLPPAFIPPHGLLFPPGYPPLYPGLLQPATTNNRLIRNQNPTVDALSKRVFLDAVLQSQRSPTPENEIPAPAPSPVQEDPIDLSMKTSSSGRGSSPTQSEHSGGSVVTERGAGSEADEESECESDRELRRLKIHRPTPLDLTTRV